LYSKHVRVVLDVAFESAGFTTIPEALCDDVDSTETESLTLSQFYLDKFGINNFLGMNISIQSERQQFVTLPGYDEVIKKFDPSNVDIQYLYLMDTLCKLLESHDPRVFIDRCASLMASDTHNITLFSDEFIKKLNECGNTAVMLKSIMCYSTWCDHSVLKKLLQGSESCDFSEGLRLLEQFENQIDFTLPIIHFPISVPSSHMIPSESSDCTVMITQCLQEHSLLSLEHIRVVKSLITEITDMNDTCCQFLAKKDKPFILFWLVPRSVVSFINTKLQDSYDHLYENGITEVAFYPKVTNSDVNIWSFDFLFTDFSSKQSDVSYIM